MSALLAVVGISSTASADVALSGSGSLTLSSDGDNNEAILAAGVAFDLSTTTANGMTISASGSVSNGSDQLTSSSSSAAGVGAGGFDAITFGVGSASITVGSVEVPNGHGDVGGVASDMTSQGDNAYGSDSSFGVNGTLEAAGISITTAIGSGSLTLGYVYDNGSEDAAADAGVIGGDAGTATGLSASLPVGNMTVGVGYTTDGTQTETGASVAMALGAGTVTVGYGAVTADDANETAIGATYATSLDADTSVTVGYQSVKAAASETMMGIAVSRSIGGGASVFLEAENYASGTNIGIGTSFSF